ncbi:MFS transporter [Micromonospora arborensis]|uniref:MFS transporter n=1 Tax=Micromonospora arborensis TaxID=2116518 RepID=UPI0033C69570
MSESTPAATLPTHPTRTPDPRRWRILGLVGVAQLMLILDVTVVAIALPHMGADLDLRRETLTWVVSGYTLAFGGLLLLGGRAADLFGSRRLILTGLLLFTLASLTAGLATSGPLLLTGRVAQGLAAAMLSPAALSLIVTIFDGDERNRALGIWSALGGSGAALGVLLGGLLTAGPGWAWIFFINVPVAVVLLFTLRSYLPAQRASAPHATLDVAGAALVTTATATLIYALVRAGEHGWATWSTALLLLVSALVYTAFVTRQRLAANPLMDVRLLARRPVATGSLLILVATALMIMMFFLGTFALQQHHGYGALTTGLLFLPSALSTMLGAQVAGRVIGRTGARTLAVAGLTVAAAGLAVPAIWTGAVPLVAGMAVAAAGIGALFVVSAATALGQVAAHEAGLASGIVSTFHEFGASVGAAVVSSVAAVSIAGTGTGGFSRGFTTAAIVAIVTAVAALAITPSPRSQ